MSIEIILCVYSKDSVKNLNICLKSLKDQTYKDFSTAIFIDGPVQKEFFQVIRGYKESLNIRLIEAKENKGLAFGLNRLIESSLADYLIRMDADDWCQNNRVEKLISFTKKNSKYAVVGSWINEVYMGHSKIRKYTSNFDKLKRALRYKTPVAHPSVLFNKNILKDDLVYDESYRTTQDLELWMRLIDKGYLFTNINEVLYNFRIDDTFFSRRSIKKLKLEIHLYTKYNCKIGFTLKSFLHLLARIISRIVPGRIGKLIYKIR